MGKVICRVMEAFERRSFRAFTSAIQVGDLLKIDTGNDYKVVPMAAATDDAVFVGISESEIKVTEQNGDEVIVVTRGLIQIACSSAVYHFGAGLLWVDASTLADDGGANTIAWVYDDKTGTRTSLLALIDVVRLGKLIEAPNA